jgi:hypothetical protein
MRVRTGRFERLRLREPGHSQLVCPSDREDGVEEHSAVAPPAAGISRHLFGNRRLSSERRQLPQDRSPAPPLLELDGPQPVAYPFVQPSPDPWCLRQPKVSLPPPHEDAEPFRDRPEAASRDTGRQFPDTAFECLDRLVGDRAFDRTTRPPPEGVAEEFAAKDRRQRRS